MSLNAIPMPLGLPHKLAHKAIAARPPQLSERPREQAIGQTIGPAIGPATGLPAPGRLTVQALVRRVDFFTLNLFLTAIEEGQICRAAAREHIAPSAATRRIQDLEEIVGVRLFDRSAKGVVPNPAGQALARHIRVLMLALDEMRRDLNNFDAEEQATRPGQLPARSAA